MKNKLYTVHSATRVKSTQVWAPGPNSAKRIGAKRMGYNTMAHLGMHATLAKKPKVKLSRPATGGSSTARAGKVRKHQFQTSLYRVTGTRMNGKKVQSPVRAFDKRGALDAVSNRSKSPLRSGKVTLIHRGASNATKRQNAKLTGKRSVKVLGVSKRVTKGLRSLPKFNVAVKGKWRYSEIHASSKSHAVARGALKFGTAKNRIFAERVSMKTPNQMKSPKHFADSKHKSHLQSIRRGTTARKSSGARKASGGPVKVKAHTIHRGGKSVKVKAFTRKKGRK